MKRKKTKEQEIRGYVEAGNVVETKSYTYKSFQEVESSVDVIQAVSCYGELYRVGDIVVTNSGEMFTILGFQYEVPCRCIKVIPANVLIHTIHHINKTPELTTAKDFMLAHYSKLDSYSPQQVEDMMYAYAEYVKLEITKNPYPPECTRTPIGELNGAISFLRKLVPSLPHQVYSKAAFIGNLSYFENRERTGDALDFGDTYHDIFVKKASDYLLAKLKERDEEENHETKI